MVTIAQSAANCAAWLMALVLASLVVMYLEICIFFIFLDICYCFLIVIWHRKKD